ncbi:TetR/AcrR family transcriptional regulator [Pendulispora rubella]|uniref:TetR/AcrR family transcriptional regulator n=1 Tax=Pendulispora rubella TaxID=2741070 RepID=A0ABZ2LE48_9BACT
MRSRKIPRLSPKKVPQQARSRQMVGDILETAARLLVRGGYEALTTNHVADEAGVGIASVYEYFPNKQAIVAAVVTRVAEDVLDELQKALAEAAHANAKEGLALWLDAMFGAIERRRAILTVMVREIPFLWEIPAVQSLGERLLQLARGAGMLSRKPVVVAHYEAVAYLMTIMVRAAVLESVIRPPPHIPQAELRKTLTQLLTDLLA